jgi:O-acetyl-ADP-ribose deacetylase (regulator of RNase III)
VVGVKKGDLTDEIVDAITNPSNSFGVMGGGVAYAIKKKGGNIIEEEAKKKALIPIGEAVCTCGGMLKAGHVIHASTMRNPSEKIGVGNVRMVVSAAFYCADSHGFESISFPGIGTGVGGVPYDKAAESMVSEIKSFLSERPNTSIKRIFLVGYSDELCDTFRKWVN